MRIPFEAQSCSLRYDELGFILTLGVASGPG
jgi:hypothetical protein